MNGDWDRSDQSLALMLDDRPTGEPVSAAWKLMPIASDAIGHLTETLPRG